MFSRYSENPIITPSMVKPSYEGLKVLGAFNPGATMYNDEIILLLRVAETCHKKENIVSIPFFDFKSDLPKISILDIPENSEDLIINDTRGFTYKGVEYLSSVSHLRLARSKDGFNFTVDEKPFILPENESESFGVEDARISKIEGTYYINYTVVSGDGYSTFLASTNDFVNVKRHGIIFPPLNKDVVVFEEKVNDKYIALHRPSNHGFGLPSIWYAESEDLIHWGKHICLLRPNKSVYESQKIGGGAPPIKTEAGWLEIYHSKGDNNMYSLNLMLLDLKTPSKILALSKNPIMIPKTKYEKDGFFGNVIFTNGHIVKEDGKILLYYGASDESVCIAETSVKKLLKSLNF